MDYRYPLVDDRKELCSELAAGARGRISILIDRLLGETRVRDDSGRTTSLCLFGFSHETAAIIDDLASQIGLNAYLVHLDAQYLNSFVPVSQKPCIVMVNLDAYDGLEQAVNSLIAFRTHFPEVGIVLASCITSGDDLGCERASIGDATLRIPFNSQRLKQAIDVSKQRISARDQNRNTQEKAAI